MTWVDEDKTRQPRPGERRRIGAWSATEGQFVLTVVPSLSNSWRGQFIWTVRQIHNCYVLCADGIAPSLDDARKAALAAARRLIKPETLAG